MGWLDQLRQAAGGVAKQDDALPVVVVPQAPRPKPQVNYVFAQVRPQRPNDPGEVEIGYFTVQDGVLTMTDEHGRPIEGKGDKGYSRTLSVGDNERVIAHRLALKIRADRSGSNYFNRKLIYPVSGVV